MYKAIENSLWLLLDKVARLLLGVVVMAMIARHLGPEAFGTWNYAIALTTILGGLAVLGLDKLLVKALVQTPEAARRLVATGLWMRLAAGLLTGLLCLGFVWATKGGAGPYLLCTAILSINIVLQSFDVFDYYYQSKNALHRVMLPKVVVFVLFCGVKLLAIRLGGTLPTFVWLSCIELVVTYVVIVVVYKKHPVDKDAVLPAGDTARTLLAQGWPLVLTSLLVLLYMKVDQLLLDALSTPAVLGQYVAAARISELWYALPTVLSTALLPVLVRLRQADAAAYRQKLERWLRLSFWTSLVLAVVVSVGARGITGWLYGSRYPESAQVLTTHIWASLPVFAGTVVMQYLVIEGSYLLNLYATAAGLVANVAVNLALIPLLGGEGAAVATVASYVVVYGTLLVLDRRGASRWLTGQMLCAWLLPGDVRQVRQSVRLFAARSYTIVQQKLTR